MPDENEKLVRLNEKIKRLSEEQAKAKADIRELKRREKRDRENRLKRAKRKWRNDVAISLSPFYPMPSSEIIEILKAAIGTQDAGDTQDNET